ncbi:hypothetical protein AGLY_002466 [Aphis glycines]|uniref:Uncharacterized protein n=1 Tax=Aphis glycines TaxID=307491 RepID=A0A6G0U0D4_APHGL|nr:hypothetical protein AGLY_002466 [Aphis glycines]
MDNNKFAIDNTMLNNYLDYILNINLVRRKIKRNQTSEYIPSSFPKFQIVDAVFCMPSIASPIICLDALTKATGTNYWNITSFLQQVLRMFLPFTCFFESSTNEFLNSFDSLLALSFAIFLNCLAIFPALVFVNLSIFLRRVGLNSSPSWALESNNILGTLYTIFKYFDRAKKIILSTLQKKIFRKTENFTTRRKTYGKLSVIILILSYEHKKFYDFLTSKLLANFRVFDRFRKNLNYKPTIKTTHKEPCIKFSKLFGHPKIFYRHFKKNFSKKSFFKNLTIYRYH